MTSSSESRSCGGPSSCADSAGVAVCDARVGEVVKSLILWISERVDGGRPEPPDTDICVADQAPGNRLPQNRGTSQSGLSKKDLLLINLTAEMVAQPAPLHSSMK